MREARLSEVVRPLGLSGALLPVRSVGVKADLRSYEQPVMLWGDLPWDLAEAVGARLYQEVPGVNRCVLDLTGRGFERARPLKAAVTRQRLDLLREADAIVMDGLRRHGLYRTVWQCPTVFVPLELDGQGQEFVVIRPVLSERAMTARPALLPQVLLAELKDRITALPGSIGRCAGRDHQAPGDHRVGVRGWGTSQRANEATRERTSEPVKQGNRETGKQ